MTDFYNWIFANGFSQTAYNAHMKACKYFFEWVIKTLKVQMDNPFENVRMPEVHYDPEIIPVEEFEQLLSVITPENGSGEKGVKRKENVNHYRPWLKKVFILSLLTGERLDGIVLLKWSHIDGNFFKIPNFKVERIQKTEGKYYSYTPITADLAELTAPVRRNGSGGVYRRARHDESLHLKEIHYEGIYALLEGYRQQAESVV